MSRFCGTRGSTPAPGPDYIRFGGHTSCVALTARWRPIGSRRLLLDAGTGLRRVSGLLGDTPFRGTLLLTHLHWDHVQGLPFFPAGDRDDAQVTLLLPDQGDDTDAEALAGPHDVAAVLPDRAVGAPRPVAVRPRAVRPASRSRASACSPVDVPHKGGRTVGYRVSDGHSSVAYVPDHCPTALGPGPDGIGEYHEAVVELARDVDLLIHDAHLRAEEVEAEGSFGHAAAEYAVRLAEPGRRTPGRALPPPTRSHRSPRSKAMVRASPRARCSSSGPKRAHHPPVMRQ